jgi:hypothetical protein
MLAATLLLPIALALLVPAGRRRYAVPRRLRTLISAAFAGVIVAGVPVAIVAFRAKDDVYTADFGSTFRPPADVFAEWTLGITPFGVGSSFPPSLSGSALLLFVGLLVLGWVMRMRNSPDRGADKRLLVFALLFPLVGAATYLPWPSYNRFYAIPFLVGGAILCAGAFAGLESGSRTLTRAGVVAWSVLLIFAAADAAGQSSRLVVRQRINQAVVARLSEVRSRGDTVFLATE